MSNYTKTTDFAAKDSLPSGNPNKVVKGSEFETEFDNIATAIGTKADLANPSFTGNLSAVNVEVSGNFSAGSATFESEDAGATENPFLELFRNSASPANNDALGVVRFTGQNSSNQKVTFADISTTLVTATDGSEDGSLTLATMQGGTLTDVMTLDESGNVSIGTSSTLGRLHVEGGNLFVNGSDGSFNLNPENYPVLALISDAAGTASQGELRFNDSDFNILGQIGTLTDTNSDLFIRARGASANMVFATGGTTERMRIDSNGNVGIGTPNAATNLEIGATNPGLFLTNSSTLLSNGQVVATMSLRHDDSSGDFVNLRSICDTVTGGDTAFVVDTGGSERFRVASDGNVGIGTPSPATLLHLEGGNPNLRFVGTSGTGGTHDIRPAGTNDDLLSILADMGMLFSTDGSERIRITDSGKVGINNTSPGAQLEVDASDGDFGVGLRINADTAWARMDLVGAGVANTNSVIFYQNDAGNGALRNTFDGKKLDLVQDGAGEIGLNVNGQDSLQIQGASNNRIALTGNGTNNNVFYLDPDRAASEMAIWTNETDRDFRLGLFNGANTSNLVLTAAGSGDILFQSGGTSEVARVNQDGDVLVGKTANDLTNDGWALDISGVRQNFVFGGSTGATQLAFYRNGSTAAVGSVVTNSTSTTYNTSSDVRLKENIQPALASGPVIDAIDVRQFDWKTNGSHQRFGMVAQELEQVFPEAVSKGETEEDMWGVDYSTLVPMLVKEIQSLRARVEALGG